MIIKRVKSILTGHQQLIKHLEELNVEELYLLSKTVKMVLDRREETTTLDFKELDKCLSNII